MKYPNLSYGIWAATTTLMREGAIRATKYLSPKCVVSAQRVLFNRKMPRVGSNTDIRLKVGRPNYAERKFIKDCIKAEVAFPVSKVQLKFLPKRR